MELTEVCELGAGSGLPGLYAFLKGAEKVVLTDYPDENILGCLWDNVKRNIDERNVLSDGARKLDARWCTVDGYEWGKDTDALKRLEAISVNAYMIDMLMDLISCFWRIYYGILPSTKIL